MTKAARMQGRSLTSTGLDGAQLSRAVLMLACALLPIAGISAMGQEMPGAGGSLAGNGDASPYSQENMIPGATMPQSNADETRTQPAGSSAGEGMSARTTLTANQIITLLHQKPEAMVDVKQVMADFFLRQGIAVQPDSITDEILMSNIASNTRLRQTVSTWLRARGYAPDEEFEETNSEAAISDGLTQPLPDKSAGAIDQRDVLPTDSELAMALRNLPQDSEVLPQNEDDLLAREEQRDTLNSDRSAAGAGRNNSDSDLEGGKRQSGMSPRQGASVQGQERREPKQVKEKADKIEVLQQNPPYNLEALRDLYTQVPEQTAELKRFGSDVFLSRGLATREMPIDLPIGPDYVLGAGDGLTISLWGGVSQSFSRVIDREGRVTLPEAGSVVLAGLTLDRAQSLVEGLLTPQFKDAHVTVSVSRLRTVRVYVVGDVQRPGAYDISSLSTPLNAIYSAGGPTAAGSLRTVRHMRGGTLVRDVDLYDFLLNGVRSDVERLEPGDTILVPAAGPQIAVAGMVKRPAIYEFKSNDGDSKDAGVKLSDVLKDAGGLRVTAALPHIRVERVEADGHRATVEVGLPEGSTLESARAKLDSFAVKDGDRVVVAPVLPYSEKAVYLAGHVVRPGKMPYRDGMKLSDAIRSYQDLLPEPAERGEIIRLMPPDLHPVAIEFSVPQALAGNAPINLQPFDTIEIRGRYEVDAPKVAVRGEVLHPGAYALVDGMTAAQLVRIAGGFKRSALLSNADLASYQVRDGREVVSERRTVAIGDAVNAGNGSAGNGSATNDSADVALKPGDVLTVHQVSGWNDIGASVTLAGEVTYSGTYGLQAGERLSSVLKRAGGFRGTAYPDGAILVRRQVKELEETSRLQLIRQMETTPVGGKLGLAATGGGDEAATLQLLVQQQNQALAQLRSQPSVGRLVIRIGPDIASWEGTPADIELRAGDVLTVPKRPGFVLVSGQVYNPSATTYTPGKDAGWYLRRSGGTTEFANRKDIFVVRANGLVVGRRTGGWFRDDDVLSTKLYPGDVVVVPQKIVGGSALWKNMLATAQVVSSIAFTAALALH
jgi:protein involved in polysaccharide export with SLBB domain